MKVKELKEALVDADDDLDVFLSIDPEGNQFRSVEDVELDFWDKKFNEPIYADQVRMSENEIAVVIWP